MENANMVYYHIVIELSRFDKNGNAIKYCEIDKTDKNEIIQSIVIPFLKDEKFQIDGHFVSRKDIDRFLIKATNRSAKDLANYENAHVPPGVIIFVFPQDIPEYDKYTTDVTKDLFKEAEKAVGETNDVIKPTQSPKNYSKVFIVHGHDNLAKQEVARFIEKLGLIAIILSEQPSEGKTIIEKIEEYSDVDFGIVLYTPCDEGREKGLTTFNPRARQNVVFEHGFLIGKLGRDHVHALKKGLIETPNDISGIVYTPMDENGGWKLMIAQEMKRVGYQIDLNKCMNL